MPWPIPQSNTITTRVTIFLCGPCGWLWLSWATKSYKLLDMIAEDYEI